MLWWEAVEVRERVERPEKARRKNIGMISAG
jgi:hypothetical protein